MRTHALPKVLLTIALAACTPEPQVDETAAAADTARHAETLAPAALPAGWQMRLDNPSADVGTLGFAVMSPGWHITTGPAGIFWQEGMSPTGDYTLTTTTHLFPSSGHHEAFGLFVGGRNLEAGDAAQSYLYFLIRGDGKFLIKRRNGSETETIQDWTANAAILPKGEEPGESVQNTLSVAVTGNQATFSTNGQPLATIDRAAGELHGQAGLRINHNLNLHVTDLSLAE